MIKDFPGGPVIRTLCFQCGDMGSIPGRRTKITLCHVVQPKKKTKIIKHGGRGIIFISFLFLTDCISEVTGFGLLVDGKMRKG